MIQELFGSGGFNIGGGNGGGVVGGGGERKISLSSSSTTPSLSPSPSPSSSANTIPTNSAATANPENLRCPRCDSANTKFCYYNNYNLTQPRHFCKTCRRYWTKGGALRNVPIGGGFRKNKIGSAISASSISKTAHVAGKMKSMVSEIGRSGFGLGFDHEMQATSSILWGSPQNSHILALLRSNPPNPNPNPNVQLSANSLKEEGGLSMIGNSHMMGESSGGGNNRSLGFDPLNAFWRSNQNIQPPPQNGSFILGHEANRVDQGLGIQELFQRLRASSSSSSSPSYYSHESSNGVSSLSISEAAAAAVAPAVGGELGYNWNPAFTWSDQLPTTNGAYP